MPRRPVLRRIAPALAVALLAPLAAAQEFKSGIVWEEPAVVTPGERCGDPPADAIRLFAGTDLSAFQGGDRWQVEHGVATARKGGITTKRAFGDVQIHIEFATPAEVEGSGQGRGNSGVYLMDRYEVQILDSYENETYFDGQAGALYKQSPPLVNASRRPGEWQSYDILFEAPRFDANGTLVRPAYATVLHNGAAVQVHTELRGNTSFNKRASYEAHPEKLPFSLQFHNDAVRFRNIWARDLGQRHPVYPEKRGEG